MKRFGFSSALIGLLGIAALVLVAASPAKAAFVVGGENGWQMSFDGMINAFMVYSTQDNRKPTAWANSNGVMGYQLGGTASQAYRIRTGLLPSIFGFNVKSPTINGVTYGVRIGLYPQIQNNGTRTGFGPHTAGGTSIDIREVYMTADGKFGQFLIGRALNLYQGQNILTDITLMGVGITTPGSLGGTTLGRIGYGYAFPSFGSQFRYTTPDMNGFKLAVAMCDPSQIVSDLDPFRTGVQAAGFIPLGNGLAFNQTATVINQPRFEMEMSYAKALTNGKINAWVSALFQEAKNAGTGHKVSSIGGAGGVQVGMGPVEVILSGFGGQAIGMLFIQDGDALDFFGKERVTFGGLAQMNYTFGKFKVGAQYGINYADRTEGDEWAELYTFGFGAPSVIKKSQQAITGMLTYNVNKYLSLVGEYTYAQDRWYDGSKQITNIASFGTILTW